MILILRSLYTYTCVLIIGATCLGTNAIAANLSKDRSHSLGQKFILDLRFYCDDARSAQQCLEPMTALPKSLQQVIASQRIGGVILFADNITSSQQLRTLTQTLQRTAQNAGIPPLFIAVDQEGGRVSRVTPDIMPAFSGNMAIGATHAAHGVHFAQEVANAQATALLAHGINVNFAPVLDVNSNPNNPVINTRAFSSEPNIVAELGAAVVNAYQAQGLLSAVKHFPGHGDTSVDSHTGLPRVEHSMQQIIAQDIGPFADVIKQHSPAFVMTAHIQYPALDDSTLLDKQGVARIKPATLSRTILTNVLRKQLQYNGLIISDAMDMAGIAHFFEPVDAVVRSFAAGADIALMPFAIRGPQDIPRFDAFMQQVNNKLRSQVSRQELIQSYQRIAQAKQALVIRNNPPMSNRNTPTLQDNKTLATALAQASLTSLRSPTQVQTPLKSDAAVLAIMPDALRCSGLKHALSEHVRTVECISLFAQSTDIAFVKKMIGSAQWDHVVIGEISPLPNALELGQTEEFKAWRNKLLIRSSLQQQQAWITQLVSARVEAPVTLVSLRSPYFANEVQQSYSEYVTYALALYDYRVAPNTFHSNSLAALARWLTTPPPDKVNATGMLPVK